MNSAADISTNIAPLPPPPPPLPPAPADFKINGNGPLPLIVIDGNITDIEEDKIDPETIYSMNVLKDNSATEKFATDKYGEKGKNGVIEIITKEKASKVLVIINGIVHEKDGMSSLNMEDIKSMNVLKVNSAVDKYGEKGMFGAIEVTTYKKGEKRPVIVTDPKSGVEYNVAGKEEAPFVVVEEMPKFPGGREAMSAWISAKLNYPSEAVKNKISGIVYVNFIVSSTGKVKNVAVEKSVSPMLNAEAIRVISSMPDWKPGSQAGKSVDVQMLVPVEFNLK
jgi:TonB family protein